MKSKASEVTVTPVVEERLLRIKQICPHLIPVSRSTWLDGVRKGIYPKPIKLSEKVTVWRFSDIQKLMSNK